MSWADFNIRQARRILSRLGFVVGRRAHDVGPTVALTRPARGREADLLRPFKGKWIAQQGLEVLTAADSPHDVVRWLQLHGKRADAMFRVPLDESVAAGVAPL